MKRIVKHRSRICFVLVLLCVFFTFETAMNTNTVANARVNTIRLNIIYTTVCMLTVYTVYLIRILYLITHGAKLIADTVCKAGCLHKRDMLKGVFIMIC